MTIKVGDKVRIKTARELLTEGWKQDRFQLTKEDRVISTFRLGEIVEVTDIGELVWYVRGDDEYHIDEYCIDKDFIAEVIPQTLDEYICGLPLEERAKKFILIVPYVRPYTIEEIFYSTITVAKYNSCDEALQATIEALKQPKEN